MRLSDVKITLATNDDSSQETVETQDTSHDNWKDRFHDKFWLEDTHGGDTDSGFSSTVSRSETYALNETIIG